MGSPMDFPRTHAVANGYEDPFIGLNMDLVVQREWPCKYFKMIGIESVNCSLSGTLSCPCPLRINTQFN